MGRFVETSEPVWQLEENTLYVLPNVDDAFRIEAEEILTALEDFMDGEGCVNTYSHYILDEDLVLVRNEELDRMLKSGDYDFVLPVNRPGAVKALYLLAKADERGIRDTAELMFYTAELVSKQVGADILKDRMLSEPVGTITGLKDAMASDEFWQNYVGNGALMISSPYFGLAPSIGGLYEQIGIEEGESQFVKNNKLIAHLSELAEHATKDRRANEELNMICKSIPAEYFAEMFKRMTPTQRSESAKVINPEFLAAESPMRIEVREKKLKKDFIKIEHAKPNNGRYILFFTKGSREEQVSFSHKSCFIVYLIFLLDRFKKGDKIDTIDIYDVQQLYLDLYGLVYPGDENKLGSYESLTSWYSRKKDPTTGKEKLRRTKYGPCLKEIRIKVTNACNKLGEFPLIHFIPSENEHIHTAKERIILPFKVLELSM